MGRDINNIALPGRIGRLLCAFLFAVLMAGALPARAGLPPGDIVVTANISAGDSGLMLVDPTTGDRTILSDNTHGTGMPFSGPVGVSVLASGDLLVTDDGFPDNPSLVVNDLTPPPPGTPARVYLIDPTTGNRTVISQNSMTTTNPLYPVTTYPAIGSGPIFNSPSIARQSGDQIVLTDGNVLLSAARVMTIDPTTGNRSVVSGSGIGSGPAIGLPGGIQVSGSTAFVADELARLLKVDLSTGDRALVSGAGTGTGPALSVAVDVAPYAGQLLVSGQGDVNGQSAYGIYGIDPLTGNRTLISGATLGTGPMLGGSAPFTLAVEAGGNILTMFATDTQTGLLTVDPLTGNRTILSDATQGTGPSFMRLVDVTVVPLPGDANSDGIVNGQDIAALASQWNQTGNFLVGDNNGDGIVNGQDLALIASNWLSTSLGHASGGTVAVPEPSSVALAAMAILAVFAVARSSSARPRRSRLTGCE